MLESKSLFNPFPGLRPFEAHETHLFFGRDGQSDELLTRLRRSRFLAVVGTSGSGKSSLVRAGLLPGLYGGMMAKAGSRWRIAVLRPGYQPITNVAFALSAPDVLGREGDDPQIRKTLIETSLRRGMVGLIEAVQEARIPAKENSLIVIDQFEEVFRFKQASPSVESENEAAAFVKLFLEATRQKEVPIYVVLTMRSDYLGDCAQFQNLPEAINDGQYLIPRMTREQRRAAITGPVAVGGAKITPRLVNRLLNDVGDNPDQLPILQHALMRTWDYWAQHRKNNEPIDLPHYEAIGGMAKALSLHADEAYHELPTPRSREIAEKLFKALTEKGRDNREIRRPIILRDACAIAEANEKEMANVVETFRRPGRTFLMPPPEVPLHAGTLIDISHESLIRNWERLKQWVEEEAQSAQIYRRLAETADLYDEGRAGLWRDPDLHIALDWRKKNKPTSAWAQRYYPQFDAAMKFLEESRGARDQEIAEKEAARQREIQQAQALAEEQRKRAEAEREKAEQERRAAVRLRRRAVALLIVLVFAVIAAIAALMARQLATQNALEAIRQAEFAEQQRKIAETEKARAEAERERAEAEEKEAKRQREIALRNEALARENARIARQNELRALEAEKIARQNEELAKENERDAIAARELAEKNRQEAVRLRRLSTALLLAAQSNLQQNDTLAVLVARSAYFLNENNSGQQQTEIYEALRKALMRPSFEPAGGPEVSRRHADWGEAVAFSPDGKWVASGSADSSVVLWNLGQNNGGTISLFGHKAGVNSVTFSRNGQLLASGSDDHTVRLWRLEKPGSAFRVFDDPKDRVWSVAFSANGQTLAAGSADGVVILWNLERRDETKLLNGHQGSVRSVAFSPDGFMLASGSADATVRLWDLRSLDGSPARILNQESRVRSVAFNSDGNLLATGGEDRIIRLWDLQQPSPQPKRLLGHEDRINDVAFSPQGQVLASASADHTARIWDLSKPEQGPAITLQHDQWVWSVAFSPDGKRLATASSDKTIRVWVSSSDLLAEISLARVKRNLTAKEWKNVVGEDIPYEPGQLQPTRSNEVTNK
jgi:WD40 repeat protein